jgi:multicomponent Na+:H+ antiporter subunit E
MTMLGRVAMLVALWLLAWGEVTVVNVVSGTVVAIVLLVAFPPRRPTEGEERLSLAGIARLSAYVVGQLVASNIVMTKQVLRPPSPPRPGVIAHHLVHPTDEVVTVISSIIALSPGTMTVDVAPDSSAIYVHFFHLDDIDAARRSIAHLEHLAIGAIAGSRPDTPLHPAEDA